MAGLARPTKARLPQSARAAFAKVSRSPYGHRPFPSGLLPFCCTLVMLVGIQSGRINDVLYLFEDFALDTHRRELRRGSDLVSLEPKVFDLLAFLIEHREFVVSKEDLIAAVWDGRIVSDSALTTRLNAARNAIADNGHEQRLLKTLPRRGIRFVGQVTAGLSNPGTSISDKPSIAVLPFANMSGDAEQEYFADGITDDIITELSRFSELLVIARNSSFQYKGRSVDVRQIGRELGVFYVLEGSVRRSGNRVRIAAQLVDAASGAHRWAERYDRKLEDIFAVQDEVVRTIAPVLAAHLNKAEVERTLLKAPSTWQVHDFYLRGLETLRAYLSSYDAGELHEARRSRACRVGGPKLCTRVSRSVVHLLDGMVQSHQF